MSKLAMTKERELGLTGPVKAIAMLVIVFNHACALYTGAWFGEPATPCPELGVFVQWLATVHVPLFLLVSGYIWAYLKMETRKYDDSCVVLRKKARRLLVPYAVVSLSGRVLSFASSTGEWRRWGPLSSAVIPHSCGSCWHSSGCLRSLSFFGRSSRAG